MGIFISVEKTVECVVIALAFACAMVLTSSKALGILQSCGYGNAKFLKWTRKKNNLLVERHLLLSLCCALASAVLALCFSFVGEWAAVISLAAFVTFFALYCAADSKVALRTPATLTPRFKRLTAVLWLTDAVIVYFAVTLLNFADYVWGNALFSALRYVPLAAIPAGSVLLICLANAVDGVYEVPKNKSYIKKARAKMAKAHVITVGITGSYGKTSAKNILAQMLGSKYRVLATPRSHNTPLGLAKAINDNDLAQYDVFLAEMGARNVGDIAELCALCPPDYAVITGICPQHLESFGSVENIVRAKGEILSATCGSAVIAADCFDLFAGFRADKIRCDCVSDVKCTCHGTSFTLKLGGEERSVTTKLLGEHAAYNIGICAQTAHILGVTIDEIAQAATELDYVEHRLQLIESNGVHILDDGYNSNVKGAEAAVNVLNSFSERKIVVTPGLVELGVLDEEENGALGAKLVGLDYVILVGDTLVGYVKAGYLAAGGDAEKLVTVSTLTEAQTVLQGMLRKGDAVLFLNDLPDIYN